MYKSEDCVIAEDVSAEGVLSGGGCYAADTCEKYLGDPDKYDGFLACVEDEFESEMLIYGKPADAKGGPKYAAMRSLVFHNTTTNAAGVDLGGKLQERSATAKDAVSPDEDTLPFVIFQGASYAANNPDVPKCVNRGHLGCLDAPDKARRLQGGSFYADRPTLVKVASGRV